LSVSNRRSKAAVRTDRRSDPGADVTEAGSTVKIRKMHATIYAI